MARQKKSVLNQFFGEPKKEVVKTEAENVENALLSPEPEEKNIKVTVSEKDVEKFEEMHDINLVEEVQKMASEQFDVPEDKVDVEIVEEELVEETEDEEEQKPRTIESLTYKELRWFQRTGQMPK